MRMQIPLTAVVLAAAAAFPLCAQGESGPLVCGGIGADGRASLAREAAGANLALELFIAKRGDYVAGANVTVTPLDRSAGTRTLHERADGPICYMRLAPGRYRIDGELNGVTRSARAMVPANPRHPVRVALAFPEDAVRGGLGPQPTPEEREEARTP